MKYKIMAFVLLFTLMGGGLSAQEEKPAKKRRTVELPKAGDIGLGIDVVPMFKYMGNLFNGNTDNSYNSFGGEPVIAPNENAINNPTVSIMGKYMITDNLAARMNIGILYRHENERTYNIDDAARMANPLSEAKVTDEHVTNNTGAAFSAGVEYRRGYRRIQGFVGGNLIYAFGEKNCHVSYGNAITEINQTPTRISGNEIAVTNPEPPSYWTRAYLLDSYNDGSTQYLGFGAHIGVEVFLASHFSLGGEVSINAIWHWNPESYRKIEGFNTLNNQVETRTDLISPGNKGFSFGTGNLGGKLYLMFYF